MWVRIIVEESRVGDDADPLQLCSPQTLASENFQIGVELLVKFRVKNWYEGQ